MGPLPSPSKKYSKISLLTLFASAIALGAALPVAAQESNGDVEEGVEEIIVQGRINFFRPDDQSSATGFALPIVDTPQAVTVLTEDLLDVAGIDSIGLATRLIPGVVSTLEGQAGAPSEVFSRGFINNDRDGYRLNGASFSRFVELDLAGVERIESVRGPSAIVFGQNSFGGILNVVTKKPTNDFRYGGAISTGTYQNVRIEGDVSGALTDSVRGRLTASYTDADSWTDGLENESMAFFPSLEVDLGPNTLLSLTGFHQRTDNTPYSGFGLVIDGEGNVSTPDTIGIQPDLFFGFNADGNVAESEATYIGATLDHEFSADMSGSVTLSYNRPDVDSQSIIVVGSIDPAADPITLVTFGQTFDETFEVFEIDVSFDWTFELFGNEQLISIRADYEDLENEETATRALTSPTLGVFPFNLSDPSANPASVDPLSLIPTFPSVDFDLASEESIEEFGFGAQVLLNPIDRLTILAGARYDKINRDVSLTRRLRAPDTVETTSIETDNISPRLGLIFEIVEDMNVYYSFSEGFFVNSVRDDFGNVSEDPETGLQHEIGFKAIVLDSKLSFGINYFSIERENVPTLVAVTNPGAPPQSLLIEGREQKHQGVEVELVGTPLSGLDIIANYSFLDAEITQDITFPDNVGNDVGRTAEHLASLYAQYEFLKGPLTGLFFGAGLSYTGELVVDDANTFAFDPRTLVSANIGYPITENLEFSINGQNLADETYFVTDSGSTQINNFFGAPRSVLVTLKAEF